MTVKVSNWSCIVAAKFTHNSLLYVLQEFYDIREASEKHESRLLLDDQNDLRFYFNPI